MADQTGVVVENVPNGSTKVLTARKRAHGNCHPGLDCDQLGTHVTNPIHASVGDAVKITLPPSHLFKEAAILYLVPITALIMVEIMNPKKHIMDYLNNPPCRHPVGETCDECDRVRRIMDGMSAGTATLVLKSAADEKYDGDYRIAGLKNRGRYYTANVVGADGSVIQTLLVDKQTGDVRFA